MKHHPHRKRPVWGFFVPWFAAMRAAAVVAVVGVKCGRIVALSCAAVVAACPWHRVWRSWWKSWRGGDPRNVDVFGRSAATVS